MTKDGVKIQCQNCLYWGNTFKLFGTGSCGNANNPQYTNLKRKTALTNFNNTCENFWPKGEYRK